MRNVIGSRPVFPVLFAVARAIPRTAAHAYRSLYAGRRKLFIPGMVRVGETRQHQGWKIGLYDIPLVFWNTSVFAKFH